MFARTLLQPKEIDVFMRNWKLFGFKKAWSWSGYSAYLKQAVMFLLVVVSLLYAGSDFANALENRYKDDISSKDTEIIELRSLLATCLTENSAGQLLKIGDDYFLCGISPLGSFGQKGR
jgi:hypothetical protein